MTDKSAEYLRGRAITLDLVNEALLEALSALLDPPDFSDRVRGIAESLHLASNFLSDARLVDGVTVENDVDKGFHDALDEFGSRFPPG